MLHCKTLATDELLPSSNLFDERVGKVLSMVCMNIYKRTHRYTHTHTDIYIYIYTHTVRTEFNCTK